METKKLSLFLFIASCWIVCVIGNEFFSSTDKVANLVAKERVFQKILNEYLESQENTLWHLQRFIDEVDFSTGDPEILTAHPVAAFILIWRQIHAWDFFQNTFHITQLPMDLLNAEVLEEIPQLQELDAAALLLINLQETYKLYPKDLTDESLTGRATLLNADQAYYLVKVAYQHEKYQHAFLWALYALKQIDLGTYSDVTTLELLDVLSLCAFEFGDLKEAIHFTNTILKLDPTNRRVTQRLYQNIARLSTWKSKPNIYKLNFTSSGPYEALCRGEDVKMITKKQRALSCRYSTGGGNPKLIYAPVKEEEEWDQPRIIRYHDIITDREIEILKNLARPLLSRSQIVGDGHGQVSDIRVSQSAGLENQNPVVARVNQRIADITGLSMESAEVLAVQNYGIGGRYTPHYDESDDNQWADHRQKRIATFLIYMSDVEMGGATVFPQVGVSLQTMKGSAVFWYNLLQNGSTDLRTLHAGCPVLVGNKWVANKWIHDFGQEFRRTCSLSDRE